MTIEVMLVCAYFPFLSFTVSETCCVLLCGVKVALSMRVVLCLILCIYIFLCILCTGGARLFQASTFCCIYCVFCCFNMMEIKY